MLAELIPGHGTVEIPRFGFWTSLWWLLATRDLPGHEHLWEATAYAFALATAVIVGWATARVAGRWTGVTAAAVAILVGPMALMSLIVVNFHASTPFTAAVLAAYLVLLASRRSWLLAVLVGALAGLNAASDPLLWVAGIAPFALGAGVLAYATRGREVLSRAAVVVGVAASVAVTTDWVMRSLGFHVIPVGFRPAHFSELPSNLFALGKSFALLFGANYASSPTYPSDPLRYAVALFAFAALGATLVAAVRLTVRRSEPRVWAYACYWATSAVLISVAFSASNLGRGGGPGVGLNYMLTLAPAAGVGLALLARASLRARTAAGLTIAAVGLVNIAGIAQGRAAPYSGGSGPELIRLLEREGLTHGYASFWEAQSLTWKSGMRVLIAPVYTCDPGGAVCRDPFFTIDSWYDGRQGRSFLIADTSLGFSPKPPAAYGRPSQVHHLGPAVTVYVYPFDLARRMRH